VRILVIDDEAPTRNVIQRMLRADPRVVAVTLAGSAEEGTVLAESDPPDVILVDVVLGAQDGRTLLSSLKLAAPGALVIVLTALPAAVAEPDALAAGADGFLHKTVALYEELAARLHDALEAREAR
jgi:DNA-binding NarL/FixJ family response regulator